MSTTLLCQRCGAPWQPDVTGACHFCHTLAPPPGVATGVAGARPTVDPDALCRLLLSMTAEPEHPLDRLADCLLDVVADRAHASGRPVARVELSLDDWVYQAWIDHGDVAALAVHTVRGVVLKRQPLPFDEWVACVAGHLAEFAGTHRRVYEAIATLSNQVRLAQIFIQRKNTRQAPRPQPRQGDPP